MLYQRVATRHALSAQRERHGHDSRQAFGNCGDGQADGGEEQAEERHRPSQAKHEDKQDNGEASPQQPSPHPVQPPPQRRFAGGCAFQQPGDMADFGCHAGRDYDAAARAGGHGRCKKNHIAAVRERRVVRAGADLFPNRLRLAGQRRFLRAQLLRFDQSRIGGDNVAGFEQEYVAGDNFRRRDHDGTTITDNASPRRCKVCQCRRCALCLKLLIEAKKRIQEDDNGDRQPVHDLAQANRYRRRTDQDPDHQATKLSDQDGNRPDTCFLAQLVRTVALQPVCRFCGRQSSLRLGAEFVKQLIQWPAVPLRRRSQRTAGAPPDVRRAGISSRRARCSRHDSASSLLQVTAACPRTNADDPRDVVPPEASSIRSMASCVLPSLHSRRARRIWLLMYQTSRASCSCSGVDD